MSKKAITLANKKKSVFLIDADKQGSAKDFIFLRKEQQKSKKQIPFTQITSAIHTNIEKHKSDYTIIDVGGSDSKIFRSCIVSADVIIVPVAASPIDFLSSEDTFTIINQIRRNKPDLKIFGLINLASGNTNLFKEIGETVQDFENDFKISFFDSVLTSRVDYKYSFIKKKDDYEDTKKKTR